MEKIEITLDKDYNRLDVALTSLLSDKGISRSKIQQLIREKRVFLNGRNEKGSSKVKSGDKVLIDFFEEKVNDIIPLNFPLKVFYEDENLFVVEKPANMVTHPSYGHFNDTLVNVLLSMNVSLSMHQGKERAGIVHRLDKETSGLLIIAKNEKAHLYLSRQFSERSVEKEYLALIWGSLKNDEMEVTTNLKRDKKNRKKITVSSEGRYSQTIFKTVEILKHISLIKAIPTTGRTHQIRVHLSYLRHPIVGDFLYGGHPERGIRSEIVRKAVKESKRFFLHSHKLIFRNLDGNRVEVVSPIPQDFLNFMEIVRKYG